MVVDEKGTPLWRFADSDGIWRYPVTIEEVSPRYLEALIQYEDRWFWDHPGVNPLSVLRAAWQDLSSGKVVSGGSTLTMQVARLLDPHPRTFGGKVRQLWRAMQLEWHLSKRDILTLYLNRAPLWRHAAGRWGGKLDLSWQTAVAAQLFRSGAAGGIAAGTQPLTSGPLA
ncbi:penicillin-binding protein 1C [Enterobacter asburiae]|uniref:Penicillin-binding protein 1C n=1 Tax=Enterobacter asburiae TaxID=61645 RepID=A0A376FKV6_ENTAS|nr:penicillin-binding protein 1C [Enterobacter asburiae]